MYDQRSPLIAAGTVRRHMPGSRRKLHGVGRRCRVMLYCQTGRACRARRCSASCSSDRSMSQAPGPSAGDLKTYLLACGVAAVAYTVRLP
jgi:hypothetical protein